MRRLRLRELERVNGEALMRAAGQNLKRLLKKRGGKHRSGPAEAISAFFLALWGGLPALYGGGVDFLTNWFRLLNNHATQCLLPYC
jgi:hypothetical protein